MIGPRRCPSAEATYRILDRLPFAPKNELMRDVFHPKGDCLVWAGDKYDELEVERVNANGIVSNFNRQQPCQLDDEQPGSSRDE